MQENPTDGAEFTDEQLRAALRRMGRDARQEAFAAGLPVIVLRGNAIVALHGDGKEEIIESLGRATDAAGEQE